MRALCGSNAKIAPTVNVLSPSKRHDGTNPRQANALDTYNDEHFEAMMKEWATRVTANVTPADRT